MASKAAGEGPYGFSFELIRTTADAASAAFPAVLAALATRGSASAAGSRGRSTADAAPKPSTWVNPRRVRDVAMLPPLEKVRLVGRELWGQGSPRISSVPSARRSTAGA